MRPHLTNWAEVVRHFIRSVETDVAADGLVETAALVDRLMGYDGVRTALRSGSNDANAGPVLAMHFRKQDTSLRLFTTIAMLGAPQDITLQELRIECFSRWMTRRQTFCEAGLRCHDAFARAIDRASR